MRCPGVSRRFVVFAALLAFALQSYIAQTHIHDALQAAGAIIRQDAPQAAQPAKAPFDHSRPDCPLCQAVIHLGAALTSPAPLLTLPFTSLETATLVFTAQTATVSIAHHWKSRAPPHA
jgi:hypothetical protein